jgi:hypothetical protein
MYDVLGREIVASKTFHADAGMQTRLMRIPIHTAGICFVHASFENAPPVVRTIVLGRQP